MQRIRPIVKCTCQYCGYKWEFAAKSKADAARMTGAATCGNPVCRAKEDARLVEWVKSIRFVDALTGKEIA